MNVVYYFFTPLNIEKKKKIRYITLTSSKNNKKILSQHKTPILFSHFIKTITNAFYILMTFFLQFWERNHYTQCLPNQTNKQYKNINLSCVIIYNLECQGKVKVDSSVVSHYFRLIFFEVNLRSGDQESEMKEILNFQ